MARNPRRVLVGDLQVIARKIRSMIRLWNPNGGMANAARYGRPAYLEHDPQRWEDVARLGFWLIHEGVRLTTFATEQQKLLERVDHKKGEGNDDYL